MPSPSEFIPAGVIFNFGDLSGGLVFRVRGGAVQCLANLCGAVSCNAASCKGLAGRFAVRPFEVVAPFSRFHDIKLTGELQANIANKLAESSNGQ